MRNKQFLLLKLLFIAWGIGIYILIFKHPYSQSKKEGNSQNSPDIHLQVSKLEAELKEQSEFYNALLDKLRNLKKYREESQLKDNLPSQNDIDKINKESGNSVLTEGPVLPILIIACNREAAIRRSLNLLLKYRPSQERFPIIVSQDCGHGPTKKAILSFGNQISLIEQPDLSIIEVPLKEKKFRGYFMIARHYKWALNQIFHKYNYETAIIVEDDLDIAPDFYEYFAATYPLLKTDPTLYCVSAWNDNGKNGLIDADGGHTKLYRTDFFPGLGWMLTKDLWGELGPKWPRSYWDDWIRAKDQRQGRACIRPEISRTRTFGKKGVSNGLFYEKYLKYIHLNTEETEFTKLDLSYLRKENYDQNFRKEVQRSQVVSLADVKSGRLAENVSYRLIYHTKENFKMITKALGLMDDFKAGVPRTGYEGVVSFFYNRRRIYLSPSNNWKGYDPTWS
ncbi:UNVERIFIED_CONTAM: hypothetical protein GTU68_064524 [Idotea baltica]|nr:hypothetical protein [Idotea baltica]